MSSYFLENNNINNKFHITNINKIEIVMSKSNENVPILGQPVFVITENSLEEKVTIVGERGLLNSLVYFAHEGILVKKLGYADDKLRKIIINEGMVTEDDDRKSLEIHLDLDKNFGRDPDATTVFVDESIAASVARKMNENQKKQCKKLLDLATKAYNTYDDIIALCTTK